MVRALLFDLDGTLFDRDAAVVDLFAAQHAAFEAELGGVPAEELVARLLTLDDHGYGDKRNMYGCLVRELGLPSALGDRLLERHRDTYPSVGALFPDVLPTLTALRERGFALAVVTNGRVETQAAKLQRLGLQPFFGATLISEQEGVRKPDRRIFERAVARLGVEVGQAWHVGDHPVADVAGASAAGLGAVWRHVAYWPEPATRSFTIHSLGELLVLLDGEATGADSGRW
jgi:putative hydrolase of the HAD superfamily